MKQYACTACGTLYDEAAGSPETGAAPGTPWERLPEGWRCPNCGAEKAKFAVLPDAEDGEGEQAYPMTDTEMSALFSNLARGCEKQYMPDQAAQFTALADYYASVRPTRSEAGDPAPLVENDLTALFPAAKAAAEAEGDRGAQRALVWSEKVTRIQRSLLTRYQKQGEAMLENNNVYVCGICGFIAVADQPPALCPVCKAPDWKFVKVEGR
ncbi:MAG: rubredoxin [Eubacteriales bacterium]|nr:rubredoxin [Eubacteriales bacterium]